MRIEIDRAFIDEVARSEGVDRDLKRRAERVAAAARGAAPVGGPPDPHPGAYRDSIKVQRIRRGYRVIADVRHAIFVEWGTRVPGHPAYHTLGNSLDAAKGD